MSPRSGEARTVGDTAPADFFDTPARIVVGAVYVDRGREMVGRARAVEGVVVHMERPTGYTWEVQYRRLRPASAWELKQLRALVDHLARQRRGMAR
ncbi:hypothetical protein [Streptomyces sp. NPDC087294]|uniref:hypothetical protein n=1 Tax=Streptomyces sp. NPDC087294 TaxID=3365777 RepID=UPI00380D7D81